MASVDTLLVGSIGVIGFAPNGGLSNVPTIFLDPANGSITANTFSANINVNINFNNPTVNSVFETLQLANTDPGFNQNAPRLAITFNDGTLGTNGLVLAATAGGTLGMVNLNGPEDVWSIDFKGSADLSLLNLSGANSGGVGDTPIVNIQTPGDSGKLFINTFGSIAKADGNSNLVWDIGYEGDANFNSVVTALVNSSSVSAGTLSVAGSANITGNLVVNGTITGAVTEIFTPYVVNSQVAPANVFTGPAGDSVVLINVVGGSAVQYNAVLLPVDATSGTTVSVVVANPGSGFPIVQTTSPAGFQFRGQGQQWSQINLSNIRGGASAQNYVVNFTFVSYGAIAGDDWLVTVS